MTIFRKDRWILAVLITAAVLLYLPGTQWGVPQGTGPNTTRSWEPDEIGPLGPVGELHNALIGPELGDPQYPLFHYIFVSLFYAPYLLYLFLSGRLAAPYTGYPFGLKDPVTEIRTLLMIARFVSVLMGAGTVAVAYLMAKELWNRTTGVIAAVFVMVMYPMFYYARMSNVDMASVFWTSLVLLLFCRSMKEGLSIRRAAWMGLFAALAVATKDQSYAVILLLPLAMLPVHFRNLREQSCVDVWSRWKAPLIGLLVAAVVYPVASGLVLRPAKFRSHLTYIRFGSSNHHWYFRFPATPGGYFALAYETFQHTVSTLGWPIFLLAIAGIIICAVSDRSKLFLLLPFPSLFFGVFFLVRTVELRFVIIWGFILASLAGLAVARALESGKRYWRALAVVALATGCGLAISRGADLTYTLRHDSRYEAVEWLSSHAQSPDRIEHFRDTWPGSLPRIKDSSLWLLSSTMSAPGTERLQGEFVLTMGPEDQITHWFCPGWVYDGLKNGSLGYELAARFQTRSLFEHSEFHGWVNPRIEIFVRR